jgi:hypothetical protein
MGRMYGFWWNLKFAGKFEKYYELPINNLRFEEQTKVS